AAAVRDPAPSHHPSPSAPCRGENPLRRRGVSDPADIAERALAAIAAARNEEDLERLRVEFLGGRSELTAISRTLASLPQEQRSAAGRALNAAKTAITRALEE